MEHHRPHEYIAPVERFTLEAGAILRASEEIPTIWRRALVLSGDTAQLVAGETLCAMLSARGVSVARERFHGHCTNEKVVLYSEKTADVVIGVGGGACMDQAKSVANHLRVPFCAIPTQGATCAACTRLVVFYNEDGSRAPTMLVREPVARVYADLGVIASAPARTRAAGIADALAKPVETALHIAVPDTHARFMVAMGVSDAIGETLSHDTLPEAELTSALYTAGLASALTEGLKHTQIGHGLYDACCGILPDWRERWPGGCLHGDLVGIGLVWQLEGVPHATWTAKRLRTRLTEIGCPVTLSDIGCTESEKDQIMRAVFARRMINRDHPLHDPLTRAYGAVRE